MRSSQNFTVIHRRYSGAMGSSLGLGLITTILKTLTAFPAVFKALTALLAAHEALAVTVAIAALIQTRAVPAVEVKTQCNFFDRINLFER